MSEKLNRKALEQGLTEEQAAQSKQQYGTNALAKKETESLCVLCCPLPEIQAPVWHSLPYLRFSFQEAQNV